MKNPVSILKTHACALLLGTTVLAWSSSDLHLTQHDVLETHGLTVLLFHNEYHRVFGDQKMNGMEIILHDQRIATSGDVRLSATPEQWDPIPDFKQRKRGTAPDEVTAFCTYPDRGLSYRIDVQPEAGGFRVAVQLDQAVPAALAGKAGFNLEFLPTLYFGKSYSVDDGAGMFPRHSDGPMEKAADGTVEPLPLATGHRLVLSPEDPSTRVTITSDSGPILLFDGRNKAQNGWFVVRTLIPAGKTGDVLVWHVRPNLIPGWTRPQVVGYNQVGYTPEREKIAVVELDPLFDAPKTARVVRLTPEGEYREAFSGNIQPWGKWMRYQYAHFDFSSVREPGIYAIEYAGQRTGPFRIAKDVYDGIWRPSLDTYLPEQMDHVKVREGYRIWHGASHLDDARQAPVNYTHFDGYKQGPTTDSPFTPGQHIPGINVGGWYDAGDFDLRTQTQALVTALRRPEARGRWGEMQLRRVVELSGMAPRCDFDEQVSVHSAEGTFRPDMVVRLAGGKNIVVDSKVSLAAYLEAAETMDEAVRAARLDAHARHLREHVDRLAAKSYWTTLSPAPEFVVLFIPGEAFLAPALEHDPALLEHAITRKVHIATPTTLVTMLRTAQYAWQQDALAENARTAFDLGRELYERISGLGRHVDRLGRALTSAVTTYNQAVGSLESRVLVSARKLNQLGVVDGDLETPALIEEATRRLAAPELAAPESAAPKSANPALAAPEVTIPPQPDPPHAGPIHPEPPGLPQADPEVRRTGESPGALLAIPGGNGAAG